MKLDIKNSALACTIYEDMNLQNKDVVVEVRTNKNETDGKYYGCVSMIVACEEFISIISNYENENGESNFITDNYYYSQLKYIRIMNATVPFTNSIYKSSQQIWIDSDNRINKVYIQNCINDSIQNGFLTVDYITPKEEDNDEILYSRYIFKLSKVMKHSKEVSLPTTLL